MEPLLPFWQDVKILASKADLLAKACLAKTLTAFGKTSVRRSGTRFGLLLVLRGVFGPVLLNLDIEYVGYSLAGDLSLTV